MVAEGLSGEGHSVRIQPLEGGGVRLLVCRGEG
jgi:hypothetical protein